MGFIGHNFGDYKNGEGEVEEVKVVLSVTILETTKTWPYGSDQWCSFYRSQFWRLQKLVHYLKWRRWSFIGHNFGDYKNNDLPAKTSLDVLSVTILETTKTSSIILSFFTQFYRSQFWRLQKPVASYLAFSPSFIGHNFGDYKNRLGSLR